MWPTPRASDGEHGGPNQRDSRGNYALAGSAHHSEIRSITTIGQLNPDWVETLMCVPNGWTDVAQEVELPEVLDHPGDYAEYIRSHRQPALMGQPQHAWEPSRLASGVKGRVPRLKMLGNGVVPIQILPIMAAIAMIERDA